ncbi:OLC1v1014099C1 [Oldenlandia corymbosa var. corymbosa]|uniref:OLC1v1014099C1 n=1 Tax=Oldenlandia corymbosa var. corymbosa TaxID=529605 RepID=A0AAV1E0A0_OLDCO|nr:OLC1v1014099C1 [Oldenlandia corymbosa var. corymbosa]
MEHPANSTHHNLPKQKASQVHELKELLLATISDHLDLKDQSSSAPPPAFQIADLGCHQGHHSFDVMKTITEAISHKYRTNGQSCSVPEFFVFFNDLLSNDFNALFNNLPADRQYFAGAVPGSFYQRLFPKASLDFVYTSKSVQWLTQAPEELLDPDSPAFNGDRIFYINAPTAVCDAYTAQFSKDLESILNARAQEMVQGGLMVIVIPGRASGTDRAQYASVGQVFIPLEPILLDLAKEGKVSKGKIASFNIATYYASPEEVEDVVQRNGCFEIVELVSLDRKVLEPFSAHEMRMGFGGMLAKHFGNEIAEEVINRYEKEIPNLWVTSSTQEGNGLNEIQQCFSKEEGLLLKDAHAVACSHTHTCNPPGPHNTHTHSCIHVHTKIVPAPAPPSIEDKIRHDDAVEAAEEKKATKRTLSNRVAVGKYRANKKAKAALIEEELAKSKALIQQLMEELTKQQAMYQRLMEEKALIEGENVNFKYLVIDIKSRIEGMIGSSPNQMPTIKIGGGDVCQNLQSCNNSLSAHYTDLCDIQCVDQLGEFSNLVCMMKKHCN